MYACRPPLDGVVRQLNGAVRIRNVRGGMLRTDQASDLEPKDESELDICKSAQYVKTHCGETAETYLAACRLRR